ncbi:RNA polymerase sigma factor [Albibacterium bauzanense]|uniref:RNA polymerase sigma-70 factor (ECF subfamily) n=1 Tax=Albibacterium bauzanense TaxID=653929 RepID=A0A4R1M2Y7_9SPHI|nr:RNA polymerase sigma factor [Albibacterium bauzanense]TCK85194.1 RNA polymerase sigma-70 factor (ECF subfamily) [Albibacterium bauzanense]
MQNNPYNEIELIVLLKAKDERAYNYLYDNYSGALYNVIIKILGEREETEDVEDVLQECFIKIWKNIDYYDINKGRLFTWMLQITKNTTIDFARSASIQKEKKTNRLENDSPIIENKRVTFLYTDHLGLNTVIDSLRKEDKQIVDLAYFKGFTQKEIADELKIPLGTVKTRARKALMLLKNILKSN